eukprot:8613052-Ditylum_brightwellii.AAC.1
MSPNGRNTAPKKKDGKIADKVVIGFGALFWDQIDCRARSSVCSFRISNRCGACLPQFKNACPPHKIKDLDALVKQHKGDEEKITATISEWWEEPQTVEPEWEDVNKKGKKAAHGSQRNGGGSFKGGSGGGGGRSGSYRSGGGGRGFYGRGMGGGRGAGPERRYGSGGERERRQQRP